MINMKFGYARVSTTGQNLEEQITWLQQQGVTDDCIYAEKYTGTTKERPEWNKLMQQLRKGDILYVSKLDRLGRSLDVIKTEVKSLTTKGVTINVGNMVYDQSTATGRLMLNVLSSFAEFERDLIVDRMQSARQYHREHTKGYREGRKRKLTPAMISSMMAYLQTHTQKETAEEFRIARSTLNAYKNDYEKNHPNSQN